jgi:hypothetical protein
VNFHKRYKKISPWWKFIRQKFEIIEATTVKGPILGYSYKDDLVELNKNGFLTVFEGFTWGASGPTIDTKSTRKGSCFHDAYFHISNQGVFKGDNSLSIMHSTNEFLHSTLLDEGAWEWRADKWYFFLEEFSHGSWEQIK